MMKAEESAVFTDMPPVDVRLSDGFIIVLAPWLHDVCTTRGQLQYYRTSMIMRGD